jgi:hypothetical protein
MLKLCQPRTRLIFLFRIFFNKNRADKNCSSTSAQVYQRDEEITQKETFKAT